MHAADLPVINMLWIGPRFGPVERLSIVSFLAHGHAVKVHAYDAIGRELDVLYRQLESRDLAAGSTAARRLFS